MDQGMWGKILTKIGVAILFLAAIDLIFVNWWIVKQSQESRVANQERVVEFSPAPSPSPSLMVSPTPEPSQITKTETVVEKQTQTIVQTAQKEVFIPIGSGSTNSKDYVDLSGLEVTIDTAKYSAIESVVFEASVWVRDGNGRAWTQFYNKSDGHPVWNSEVSTTSAKGVLLTSGKITLTSGEKTYKTQAKTDLTEYTAHVDGARIKITLQ